MLQRRPVAVRIGLILLLTALMPGWAANAQTAQRQPVRFDLTAPVIGLVPDHRLDYGDDGTIELGMSLGVDTEKPFLDVQSIAAHASAGSVRFDVQIRKGGTEIGMYNGSVYAGLPFDFRDGAFHQVALVTRDQKTEILIDAHGIGSIPVGYGDRSRLRLILGGDGLAPSRPYFGYLYWARLWDRPLDGAELLQKRETRGRPEAAQGGDRGLVLYSTFTTAEASLTYVAPVTENDAVLTARSGTREGAPFVDLVPKDFALDTVEVTRQSWITSLQLTLRDAEGNRTVLPRHGEAAGEVQTFAVPAGERLTAISGTSGQYVDNIVLHFASGAVSPVLGGRGGPVPFRFEVPQGTAFEGLAGDSGRYLSSIALAYTTGPSPDLDVTGRWIADNAQPPVRDDGLMRQKGRVEEDGSVMPHGNFTSQNVMTLRLARRGHRLELWAAPTWAVLFDHASGMTYKGANTDATLTFTGRDSFTVRRGDNYQRFNRAKPYEILGSDAVSWGGTFEQESIANFYDRSFAGYDVNQMNPQNLQLRDGLRRPVFRMPGLNSRDYYPVVGGVAKAVPFGMYLLSNIEGREGAFTDTVSNAEEHNSSWSFGLGMSLGVEGIGAAGYNFSYQQSTKTMNESEQSFSLTRDIFQKYAMVLDETHVELDPDFRARVLEVRDRLRAGEKVNLRKEIIEPFGTHYPHAVTLGAIATMQIAYSKSAYLELQSKGWSFSRHAEASLEGITAKQDINAGQEWSDQFRQEMSRQRKNFRSIGGEPQAGGGFSVGREEVPIMLDLRPLHLLLSPVYFDDWIIHTDLRAMLQEEERRYGADSAKLISSNDEWEPYLFAVTITKIDVDNADELDGWLELYGELTNRAYKRPGGDAETAFGGSEYPFQGDWRWGRANGVAQGSAYAIAGWAQTRTYAVLKRDLCSGYAQLGGWLKDEDQAENSDTDLGSNYQLMYWKYLSPAPLDVSLSYTTKNDNDPNTKVTFRATARRVSDVGGGFRPLPACP